ncbi:MAG: helix-turn-helix domain-containing protein [bacterium]
MIYFIQSGISGPIKIGFTKHESPKQRLSVLQTNHHEKLNLLGTMPGSEKDEAFLHARFKRFKIRGEWFQPVKELIDFLYPIPLDKMKIEFQFEPFPIKLNEILIAIEIGYIEKALEETEGHQNKAAKLLGINERAFWHKVSKYKIKIDKKE